MLNIQAINWETEIQTSDYDDKVGIRVAKLAGDSTFCTYITVIDKNKGVNPHYHKVGDEHYHIISGNGLVRLKNMSTQEEQLLLVKAGESFIVPANTMHQLLRR